jgi:heme exporter protein D
MLSGQLGFVAAAYAFAAVILISLVVWVFADYRIQRRTLADLEAHGIRRRSAGVRGG